MRPLNPYASPALDAAAKALADEPQFNHLNPYAAPAAAQCSKRSLLGGYQIFANVATFTSCATSICVAYATNSLLLTIACSVFFLSLWAALAAAACWVADRLSVERPSWVLSSTPTTEESP